MKILRVLFVGRGELAKTIKSITLNVSKKKGLKISIVKLKANYFDSAIFVNPNGKQMKKAKMLSSKMNLPVLIISSKELNVDVKEISDYPFVFVVSDFSRVDGTGLEKFIESFLDESYGFSGKRVAYCAVKWKNKILLIKRAEGYLIWEFPGGKIEIDETPKQAALRELKEETGIIAKNAKFVGRSRVVYSNGEVRHNWLFLVEVRKKPEVKLNPREHDGYKWVDIKDLLKQRNLGLSVKSFRSIMSHL